MLLSPAQCSHANGERGSDAHGTRLRKNNPITMRVEIVLSTNLLRRHHFVLDVERASRRLSRTVHYRCIGITMI
jgi:hypothetical protein